MGLAANSIAARIVHVHPVPMARITKSMTETHAAANEHRIMLFFRKEVQGLLKPLR